MFGVATLLTQEQVLQTPAEELRSILMLAAAQGGLVVVPLTSAVTSMSRPPEAGK